MKSDKRLEMLLSQYHECVSFIRQFDSTFWQVASVTMAINSFLAITYLGYAKTFAARLVILLAALAFTFVSTIRLQKHRFFIVARSDDFRWIQTELRKLLKKGDSIREIKLKTGEIQNGFWEACMQLCVPFSYCCYLMSQYF